MFQRFYINEVLLQVEDMFLIQFHGFNSAYILGLSVDAFLDDSMGSLSCFLFYLVFVVEEGLVFFLVVGYFFFFEVFGAADIAVFGLNDMTFAQFLLHLFLEAVGSYFKGRVIGNGLPDSHKPVFSLLFLIGGLLHLINYVINLISSKMAMRKITVQPFGNT